MIGKALHRLDRVLTFFEEWTLFITVVSALLSLFVSVVTRYTITYTMTWPEELVRQVIIYTTFIGCAAGVKNRALIRIDAVPNVFPWLKKPLDFLAHLSLLGFSIFIFYFGIQLVRLQAMSKLTTVAMKIPYVVLYLILPLMGVVMALRLLHVMYEDLTGNSVSDMVDK